MAKNASSVTMVSLKAAALARKPVMLVGAPGVGKTATIRALAESMGYDLITIIGSQMDPTDVTGLPKGEVVAHDDEGNEIWGTVYLAPWWQVQTLRKKKVILFFDEFSNTPSAVRAALLTFFQNREFTNGEPLPDETIVIGAMNPTEQAADGWELDKPTTNRITFLVWRSLNQEWFDGMLTAWGRELTDEELQWRRKIVGFLKDNPSYIHRENDEIAGTPEAHDVDVNDPSAAEVLRYAWASKRSWDNLASILSYVEKSDTNAQDEIASGTVGAAAAISFRDWLMRNDVIDPSQVLNDPKSVDWSKIDVSDANVLFRAIPSMITPDNWEKVIDLLQEIADKDAQSLVSSYVTEFLKLTIASARKKGPEEQMEASNKAKKMISSYAPGRSA